VAALPLALSLGIAALIAPPLVGALRATGRVLPNHRGDPVPFPTGIVIVAASAFTLASLALIGGLTGLDLLPNAAPTAAVFVIGVALLGLVDDLLGGRVGVASRRRDSSRVSRDEASGPCGPPPRGLRRHARALARGHPSTGVIKALGTLLLSAVVVSGREASPAEGALAVAVLVLSAHAFNLLDLRPGRSIKAFHALAAALALASLDPAPLWTLGVFLGPVLVLLPLDLRAGGMLGDTGASAIGAVAGLWIVLALPAVGQAVALLVLVAVAIYGELRSITALVERTPLLRQLDSLGRTHA
jgi:UDP-GlcNAc:undecaprenyl-phosphate/decaprenyl-phosphate GlcNAc-1-phosphate transferase